MLLRLLRFLSGYVSFTVRGKYPERFINIAARNRVRLWDVRRLDDGFHACMYRSDYRKIRSLARKSGVRLRADKKFGIPAFLFAYRDRAGVLFGACAFMLTVFVMSLFIWSIDITGLETVSDTDMQVMLREHGLYVGAFKPSLDYQQIARDILVERHEIGWMAVNVTGSYASVEVKEESPAPEVHDIYSPCNIKAKCDGQILRIEAAEGEKVLTEGSGVIEGQLIVSGVVSTEQGAARLVHADARVIARTTRRASFSTPEKVASLRPDGDRAVRKSVWLFGFELPYRFEAVDSVYAVADSDTSVPAPLDTALPVGVTTQQVTALRKEEILLDKNSAEELLLREAELYETFALADCTVESRDYHVTRRDGIYTLNATYICTEDIACSEPIGTDENTDMTRYVQPTQPEEQ